VREGFNRTVVILVEKEIGGIMWNKGESRGLMGKKFPDGLVKTVHKISDGFN